MDRTARQMIKKVGDLSNTISKLDQKTYIEQKKNTCSYQVHMEYSPGQTKC